MELPTSMVTISELIWKKWGKILVFVRNIISYLIRWQLKNICCFMGRYDFALFNLIKWKFDLLGKIFNLISSFLSLSVERTVRCWCETGDQSSAADGSTGGQATQTFQQTLWWNEEETTRLHCFNRKFQCEWSIYNEILFAQIQM